MDVGKGREQERKLYSDKGSGQYSRGGINSDLQVTRELQSLRNSSETAIGVG